MVETIPRASPSGRDRVAAARAALHRLALDLRWTWRSEAVSLFHDLDPEAWDASGHNPVWLLQQLTDRRLATLLEQPGYLERLEAVGREFDAFRAGSGEWFADAYPDTSLLVGIFAAEFALAECLPLAAGGLGAVAGELLKTASSLGVPTVGVGLRYSETSYQWLDRTGQQQESWEPVPPGHLPLTLARNRVGIPVEVTAPLPHGPVRVRVWEAVVGRSRLVLLDTDLPGNSRADRLVTRRIYPSDPETRLAQYLVLGIAGSRALSALGLAPTILHLNEGHSALAALGRVAWVARRHGLSFDEARIAAAPSLLFTTHTPVPAGHDYFPPRAAARVLAPLALELGLTVDALVSLGRHTPDDPHDTFCPTVLALRLAGHRNAVSRLHGVVTRTMWRGLWPRVPVHEIPVGSVTNGVHLHTWASPEMASVLAGVLGAEWEIHTTDPRAWDAVRSVPLERLWEVRNQQRARLVERAQGWLALQQARRSMSSDPSASRERLDPDVLTIGFVGRFVAYKRPTLFLTDRERLVRLLGDATRPVQIVFAGRAHPNDFAGKGLLREVVRFAREAGLSHRIVFLENFDVAMDHWLSEGVDVWLNTSRRPDEACGIAGMKAGINGALNLSTLDGWWDEVWDEHAARARPPIGWAIGSREVPADPDAQDLADAASLYDLLEHEVRDAFYDRDPDGIPRRWVASIRESIATFGPLWTSSRMVREYTSSYYVPGTTRSASLGERRAARARDGARHLTRLARAWPDVRVGRVDARRDGRGVSVRAEVWLGKLTPRDVAVQLWVDRGDDDARAAPDPMEPERPGSGPRVFRTRLPASALPPDAVLAVRVLPTHPSIDDPLSTGLVAWSG